MDYGQPMSCNCGSRSCSSYSPEPEKKVEEIMPQWIRDMLDDVDMTPSRLEPVTSQSFNRRVPTQPNGDSLYPFNANTREFGSINGLAGMLATPRFEDISTNNLCKEINVQEPMTRMEVTEENFFEMHELAKNNGYEGDAEDFRQALNAGEPIHLTRVEERKVPEVRNAAGLDVKAFLKALGGLTGGVAEVRGLGLAGPIGRAGPAYKPTELPEVIRKTADPATLTEYISKTMIPAFVKEITALAEKFEGIDLLRQQRRLQERLNKLMMYSTKPERIIGNAIHDEHELAIYKCYIASQVVAGQLGMMAGQSRINDARDRMLERKAAVVENQAKQKKEEERKELLSALQRNLFLLAEDVTKMETRTAATYLKKLLDGLGVDLEEPKKPVTEKDLITKGVDAVKPFAEAVKPYSGDPSPLANLSDAERKGIVESFRSAFSDALANKSVQERFIAGLNRPLTDAEQAVLQRLSGSFTNAPLWQGTQF